MSGRLKLCMTKDYLADAVGRWRIGDPPRTLDADEQRSLLKFLKPFAVDGKFNKYVTPDVVKRAINRWANVEMKGGHI